MQKSTKEWTHSLTAVSFVRGHRSVFPRTPRNTGVYTRHPTFVTATTSGVLTRTASGKTQKTERVYTRCPTQAVEKKNCVYHTASEAKGLTKTTSIFLWHLYPTPVRIVIHFYPKFSAFWSRMPPIFHDNFTITFFFHVHKGPKAALTRWPPPPPPPASSAQLNQRQHFLTLIIGDRWLDNFYDVMEYLIPNAIVDSFSKLHLCTYVCNSTSSRALRTSSCKMIGQTGL